MSDDQQDIDDAAEYQQQQSDQRHAEEYPPPFSPEWTRRMRAAQERLKAMSRFELTWPTYQELYRK